MKNYEIKYIKKKKQPYYQLNKKIKYLLQFKTIISPGSIKNIRLLNKVVEKNNNTKKIYIKQSYILLVWINYLKKVNQKEKIGFIFFKPKKQKKITIIKAPMAHKTFSQEQFLFKYFNLTLVFYLNNFKQYKQLNINQSIKYYFLQKKKLKYISTNLFFLHRIVVITPVKDKSFLLKVK